MDAKEKKFFAALEAIFIGAQVEGESGFINLMRIKQSYYQKGIFPRLQQDIAKAVEPFPEFREELFDRLYAFFHRYFSESGSIYFRYTPLHERVYEQVYTDDRDVMLFWKTHMLYYVKTERLFKSMTIKVDKTDFYFDVSKLELKKANNKGTLVYEVKEVIKDGTIAFYVHYSEKGRRNSNDAIQNALRDLGVVTNEDTLDAAFRIFEKQSEVDFFINKDAKRFLYEQFDLWLYQYVFEPEQKTGTAWSEKRIQQLQVIKEIAYSIIDFVAQFENELVKIWNKPKFVLNSHYVITLDRLLSQEGGEVFIKRLFSHKGIDNQIVEWKKLGIVDENFSPHSFTSNPKSLNIYQHLPIDSRHFEDMEVDLLSLFDHLDQAIDGRLIHSDNYQGLVTIQRKFDQKIQTVYIDPPFNKANDPGYQYVVNYRDSTWISLLENRLYLLKGLLCDYGSLFVRCDYNGDMFVRILLSNVFEYFKNEICVKRTRTLKGESGRFHTATDTIFLVAKSSQASFYGFRVLKPKEKWEWVDMHLPGTRKNEDLLYRDYFGKRIKAPKGRRWTLSQEGIDDAISKGLIKLDEESQMPKFLTKWETLGSNWTDIPGYSPTYGFTTENSEQVLQRVIESTSKEQEIILDCFLGIGTSISVAHKLNRKWIGIELGEHISNFYIDEDDGTEKTGISGRLKEVLNGDGKHEPCGITREIKWNGGGFYKYFKVEQYEDVLKRVYYTDNAPVFIQSDIYSQYVFLRDPKLMDNGETGESVVQVASDGEHLAIDLSKLYPDIDLAETLSCITGKWIRRIHPRADNPSLPGEVEFEDGTRVSLVNPPWELIKPLVWW